MTPPQFKSITNDFGQYMWPEYDTQCAAVVFRELEKLEPVVTLCKQKRVVVQAGGNCGVFPKALADMFKTVYTFEPDPLNFFCLCRNAAQMNVYKFNAALSYERGTIGLENPPGHDDNCGSLALSAHGAIPRIRIDDLQLSECDLIYLDIEGHELEALKGAMHTMDRCQPVIVCEEKDLGASPQEWLRQFGYKKVNKLANDCIYLC